MPTTDWLDGGWLHVYWSLGGRLIWEGLMPPEAVATARVAIVCGAMAIGLMIFQRWEDWRNNPRHK